MTPGPFDDVDLKALFTDISDEQIAQVRSAAGELDAARPSTNSIEWDWYPDHVDHEPLPPRAGQLIVLSTASTVSTDASGLVEFELCVVREHVPTLTVTAMLAVDCWCWPDHSMHAVRSEGWMVGTATAFVDTFRSAVRTLVAYMAGSHDPNVHRTAAGLPNPDKR